ncbi:MAG: hypothetical protein ACSHYA_04395 [Opitutaceae bacterium]
MIRKLIILIAVLGLVQIARAEKPVALEAFVGKMLDEETKAELVAQYKVATGEDLENEKWGVSPWWLKKFEAGKARWMLLLVYPGYNVPDVSYVEAHVFDEDWKRIAKQSFPTGYRMFLKEAEIQRNEAMVQDALVIKTTSAGPFMIVGDEKKPAFEQGNFQRQYYGFTAGQLCMIRMEDDEGTLVRNHYRWRAPSKGPAPPKLDKAGWLALLKGDSIHGKLSSLVWLTGSHLPSSEERKENHNQQSIDDSKLFESVRDDPRTKTILAELQKHENPWIGEYASLGLLNPNE